MKKLHILLVEDNEGDILLTKEALEESEILTELSIVKDGKEALDFISRQGKYLHVELPDLLLLDINLPKINGHEVLKFIKKDKDLHHIPVIMLTTSTSEKDISLSLENNANYHIIKPADLSEYIELIAIIENFNFSASK